MLLCGIIYQIAYPQVSHSDTQKSLVQESYDLAFMYQQLLRNGKEYGYFYPSAEGKHYLHDPNGSLQFQGSWYHKLDLYYDLYNDLVFIRKFLGGASRYLIIKQAHVEGFELLGRSFLQLSQPPDSQMNPGLHLIAYDRDGIRLYVRKQFHLASNKMTPQGEKRGKFVNKDIHYLIKDDICHLIRSKQDLYEALGKPAGFKTFLKEKEMKMKLGKAGFDSQIVRVLDWWLAQRIP